jgi:uncharacterized protein (DUF983 family)
MPASGATRFLALLRQRCPHCCEGRVFRTATRMNPTCPVCGLLFEREEGYFLGAMYISYGMSAIILITATLLASLVLPTWDMGWLALLVSALYVPFVPLVFRYSRVIWIYFDRWAWPR